uniref:RanBP2-type domain-containing protein n=1 Tax=Oryza glumipatula TaxID=40148 RepID=A0A0D9Y6F4_9ORYZ
MRPRGRGDDVDEEEEEEEEAVDYSPHRSELEPEPEPESETDADADAALQPPPPPPARAPLSSLVVKPSPREGDGASSSSPDAAAAAARSSPTPAAGAPGRHRGSSLPRRRRDLSPPERERRRSPPPPLLARRRPPGSPPPQRRRLSPPPTRRLTPPDFQPRHPRPYHELQGYGMHAGLSPQRQHRPENRSFDDTFGPRYAHGYQGGGRGVARFRDGSPPYGRGGRSYGRGSGAPGKEFINIDGEYVHRNDPNLSPREGDWICQNPNCGNLNFARRTHCNNCNKYRYSREVCEPGHSPHRDYVNPPRGPARNLGPSDRAPPREMARYGSPPRGWGSDPKGYPARSPPDHAGRYADPVQRERMGFRGDRQLRDRVKHDWSSAEDYNPRERPHDDMYLERSRRRSVSPRDNWGHNMRYRSRSPAGGRLKGEDNFRGGNQAVPSTTE